MRILQVTNLVSHHQLPLARQLASIVGEGNFRFAAISMPDQERARLGWNDAEKDPWILRAAQCPLDHADFVRWWNQADVVLCGERLLQPMSERLDRGQLCFYMSERWWKPPIGAARMLSPQFALMARQFRRLSRHPLFHYLPKGPFASSDIDLIAKLEKRKWLWGYFTEKKIFTNYDKPPASPVKVLWAGRMLSWKRVDVLIRAAAHASQCGVDLQLTLVGDGPMRVELERLAGNMLPPDSYTFHNPISSEQVPRVMRDHHVYILPSTGYEGWGAVINEAMSYDCAVIASSSAGSAASMIVHDFNGLLFDCGDWRGLSLLLQQLASDDAKRLRLTAAARDTIENLWSPRSAAERFVSVADALLRGAPPPIYENGPMSFA